MSVETSHNQMMSSSLSQSTEGEQINTMVPTAAVFFAFLDDKFDKQEQPNRLILARLQPTVADVCSTIRALFFVDQDVVLTCSFVVNGALQEFQESSQNTVPANDRNSVLLIKSRFQEGGSKMSAQALQIASWLQQNGLAVPDIVSVFQKQKVTVENMKFLKDTDLQQHFGIQHWETRIAILDAIQKYYAAVQDLQSSFQPETLGQLPQNIQIIPNQGPPMTRRRTSTGTGGPRT